MTSSKSPAIRAVAYYRMSTDRQEASISEQRAWAERACREHNLTLVHSFEDPGIPGSEIEQRPGLMALLDFCARRFAAGEPVEALVCWDLDRLSRADSLRTAGIICRLIDAGACRVLTAEGWTDFNDDMDRVLLNLRQDLSRSAYSKSISKNVSRAMIERAKRGLFLGGPIPYAYIVGDDGHLALGDPEKADAVRWMFAHYAESADSLAAMANLLRARGVPPPRIGGRWDRNNVRTILINPRYTGRAVWNTRHGGKYHRIVDGAVTTDAGASARESAKRGRKLKQLPETNNAPEDYFIVPDAHPALVDSDTFAKVQARLKARQKRTTPAVGGGDWLLSGLLFCGACGGVMYGAQTRCRRGDRLYIYRRYVCSTVHKLGRGHCNRNGVEQSGVLKAIAKLVQEEIATPEKLRRLRERIQLAVAANATDQASKRKELRRRVAELEGQMATATRNMALAKSASTFARIEEQVSTWEKEKDEAANALAVLEAAQPEEGKGPGEREELALKSLERLRKVIENNDPAEVRAALQNVVTKVILTFRQGVIPAGGGKPGAAVESLKVELAPELAKELKNLLGTAPHGQQVTIFLEGPVSSVA